MPLTLTRKQINAFLHTGHIIPVSKGLRQDWLDENAPGWRDGALMDALKAAGALERSTEHFSGWRAAVDKVTLTNGIDPALVTDVVKGTVHVKD